MRKLAALVLLSLAAAAAADPSLDALRAENARLKAQLEALQRACPTAAAPAASPAPAVPPTIATPAAPAAGAAPPPAEPAPAAPAIIAMPAAPPGYRLVPITPPAEEQENCTQGLFAQSKDAPWKHQENWDSLSKKMKPSEVETTLGKTHTTAAKGARTVWEYGRCGTGPAQGYVVFENDGLLFWQRPDF
ncbi:MAG: hypothetical protein ISP90_15830 [Nevskia sp.]|nr:hypothetical protein [Nevskia sp.]